MQFVLALEAGFGGVSMRRGLLGVVLGCGALSLGQTLPGHALLGQTSGGMSAPMGPTGPRQPQEVTPPIQAQLDRDRQRRREEKLVADTDRLVVLARELKAEIDKGAATSLSVGAVKRAEEMEKLARGVKKSLKEQ